MPRRAVLAPRGDAATPLVAVVAEGLRSGRIVGFTITPGDGGPLDVGIRVSDARIDIDDVEVSGARGAGIVFQGRGDATLRASLIHGNDGAGLVVTAPAAPRLAHNRILDNGRGARRRAGVELEAGAVPELTGNVIAGNSAEGIRGATTAMRAALLENNLFEVSGRPNRAGAVGRVGR
jgi:hypothetical protein